MKKIRTVFCGCGHRAFGTGNSVMTIDAYETVGVCDPYEDKAVSLADEFEKLASVYEFSKEELEKIVRTAVNVSFADLATKEKVLARIEENFKI